MKLTWLLAVASCAASSLAAPAIASTPPSDVKPSADVAWLIIGIQPDNTRMEIAAADLKEGAITYINYNFDAYRPNDGFIVVKAKPGVPYTVAASSLMVGKSIFGLRYQPCGQDPVFQADAGKVVYITTMSFRPEGQVRGSMNFAEGVRYSNDLEGARTFLKAHYPGLSDNLEQGQYQVMPLGFHRCPGL